ncbi:MAG: FCD domain-containing protein, partial [Chloroflexi bacterium]|nr:FCD domain-containing protein [Chloroflexota bacterium]
ACLAASRRTDDDLEVMQRALDAMAASRDEPDGMVAADVWFHQALLDAAHNELLSRMEVVLAAGLQVRDRFVHHGKHGSDPMPTHRALLEAVRDGDADLARRTVEALLAQASADLAEARAHAEKSTRGTSSRRARSRA